MVGGNYQLWSCMILWSNMILGSYMTLGSYMIRSGPVCHAMSQAQGQTFKKEDTRASVVRI